MSQSFKTVSLPERSVKTHKNGITESKRSSFTCKVYIPTPTSSALAHYIPLHVPSEVSYETDLGPVILTSNPRRDHLTLQKTLRLNPVLFRT